MPGQSDPADASAIPLTPLPSSTRSACRSWVAAPVMAVTIASHGTMQDGAMSRRLLSLVATLAIVALLVAGCSDDAGPGSSQAATEDSTSPTPPDDKPSNGNTLSTPPSTSKPATPQAAGTIADGLTTPWGLAFLPDGSALVSERDTALVKRVSENGAVRTVGEVPGVDFSSAEGGLLGLAVTPPSQGPTFVYAYLSTTQDNRVVRMPYASGGLGKPEVVVDDIPVSTYHNGGRVEFGPDGKLYVTTGDATEGGNAPDPDSLGGKILRLTPSGRPAPDNPTENSAVWTLGHRNVQGISWDARDNLWASEFGQDTWDELNLIEAGNNYGWPRYEGSANAPGFEDPDVQWRPDEASPSGIAYAEGSVWVAALGGERLWRVPVDGADVVGQPEAFFTGEYGRLRTVVPAPDGSLWLMTSNTDGRGDPAPGDDRIIRLTLD